MTQIMELVITRGNDAYDAFRDALIEINAPKHATDMLPNYSKATADKNKKPPKNSTKNSEEGGSSSHVSLYLAFSTYTSLMVGKCSLIEFFRTDVRDFKYKVHLIRSPVINVLYL